MLSNTRHPGFKALVGEEVTGSDMTSFFAPLVQTTLVI